MGDPEILARIPVGYIDLALRELPHPADDIHDCRETDILLPEHGWVRLTFTREKKKIGRQALYCWSPSRAAIINRRPRGIYRWW